ncbi:MAG: hypothetical protein R3183_08805 [Oleiphilaceae bacterium]|nr:hypothetical protein [Oleiphilaceae bacterium]
MRHYFAFLISAFFFVLGCAHLIKVKDPRTGIEHSVPTKFAKVPGVEELAKLCATKGGRKINRTLNAEGYLDRTESQCGYACWEHIIFSHLKYVEIEIDNSELNEVTPQSGIWKFYKSSLASNECEPHITGFVKARKRYQTFTSEHCLSAVRNSQIESRYERLIEEELIPLTNKYNSQIWETTESFRDRNDKTVIAEQRSYYLVPNHSVLDPGWGISCGQLGFWNYDTTFEMEVFKLKGVNKDEFIRVREHLP